MRSAATFRGVSPSSASVFAWKATNTRSSSLNNSGLLHFRAITDNCLNLERYSSCSRDKS
ncbi:hypothetical protein Barb7_02428 [Bacteroidales bacterium Barb7]|nr:hypothetical protein Barb7_02428 [Bacteroidales bacterium Barb7]